MTDDKSSDDVVLTDAQMRAVIERANSRASSTNRHDGRRAAAHRSRTRYRCRVARASVGRNDQPSRCRPTDSKRVQAPAHDAWPSRGPIASEQRTPGWWRPFRRHRWMAQCLPDDVCDARALPDPLAMVGITLANLLSRRIDRRLGRFMAQLGLTWVDALRPSRA